jgi:hypothetical protein
MIKPESDIQVFFKDFAPIQLVKKFSAFMGLEGHHCFHNISSLVLILSYFNPDYTHSTPFQQTHFNPSTYS